MLTFYNPGEIDPRLFSTFGVSAKDTDSPIGYFGTGLKYAISIVLRNKGSISVWSGQRRFTFSVKPDSIRGREFDFVVCNGEPTSFTLDLGKNWEPWMAYRELYSNALDEGGMVLQGELPPAKNTTVIQVEGLDEIFSQRNTWFLSSKPVWKSSSLEIHAGESRRLFYRGIYVGDADKPGVFTYNLLSSVDLAEDRTLRFGSWSARGHICQQLIGAPSAVQEKVLLAGKEYWEWHQDWGANSVSGLKETAEKVNRSQRHKMPPALVRKLLPTETPPKVVLTPAELGSLSRSVELLRRLGIDIAEEIIVVDSLASGVLGSVIAGKIILTRQAFQMGTKIVAGTILEEHIHITMGLRDNTYEFQNYLLNLALTFGEQFLGEPF